MFGRKKWPSLASKRQTSKWCGSRPGTQAGCPTPRACSSAGCSRLLRATAAIRLGLRPLSIPDYDRGSAANCGELRAPGNENNHSSLKCRSRHEEAAGDRKVRRNHAPSDPVPNGWARSQAGNSQRLLLDSTVSRFHCEVSTEEVLADQVPLCFRRRPEARTWKLDTCR